MALSSTTPTSMPNNNDGTSTEEGNPPRSPSAQPSTSSQPVALPVQEDEASNHHPPTLEPVVVPHILPGITQGDLDTALRVLNAVAALNPKHQKKNNNQNNNNNNKRRKQNNGESVSTTNNDNDNENDKDKESSSSLVLEQYQQCKELRPLRKSLAICLHVHQLTMYQGKTEQDHYQQRNELRTLKRQKKAEADMQKKYVASTALRRGRMEKLQEKQLDNMQEEYAKIQHATASASAAIQLMIPDGHVDSSNHNNVSNSTKRLLENDITSSSRTTNDPDTVVETVPMEDEEDDENPTIQLPKLRSCYVCKTRYRELHHFYDQLCPSCATLNWEKRHQIANLKGKVAVVTGSRVKIGYQTCLKLLRAGATVIATTRFPNAAAENYQKESDFHVWSHRLQIYGLDLRDVTGLEAFTRYLKQQLCNCGLDILINNACQTVRRPTAYYTPLIQQEQSLWKHSNDSHKALLTGCITFERVRRQLLIDQQQQPQHGHDHDHPQEQQRTIKQDDDDSTITARGSGMTLLMNANPEADNIQVESSMDPQQKEAVVEKESSSSSAIVTTAPNNSSENNTNDTGTATRTGTSMTTATTTTTPFETRGISHSAAMSQMVVLPEDVGINDSILPPGVTDINGQQLDLRKTNSWLLTMEQVSTPEVMECMFINAIAPFVLNSRLKPLMTLNPQPSSNGDGDTTTTERDDRYVINVSAMEGKFYRYKMANHPHTNMAKAALNMMTRTSAEELAKKDRIFMNSVDTGWINDENPLERAHKTAKTNLFQTPIDEIDAAARILDPIFVGVNGGSELKDKDYGKFLKDYRETEW